MQGFNMGRYVPPDLEGTVTSGNKLHSKHPPGRRASQTPGSQTVRFEMPYAIWCGSCPKPTIIGQGVRFNAEKRRAGNYHSTPIWTFRMRHADCGGAIEIRTDPQNTAYVVVSGATKRDTGPEDVRDGREVREGEYVLMTDAEREAMRKSAFASLERTIEDREALKAATERIDDLEDVSKRRWEDPGERNRALRKEFRVGRKERERQAGVDDALRERMGFGLDLAPEREEDARRAALVDFGADDAESGDRAALGKPLFRPVTSDSRRRSAPGAKEFKDLNATLTTKTTTPMPKGTPKAEIQAAKRRQGLASKLATNTRMSQDPFLADGKSGGTPSKPFPRIPGLKRKRATQDQEEPVNAGQEAAPISAKTSIGLVAYGSESD